METEVIVDFYMLSPSSVYGCGLLSIDDLEALAFLEFEEAGKANAKLFLVTKNLNEDEVPQKVRAFMDVLNCDTFESFVSAVHQLSKSGESHFKGEFVYDYESKKLEFLGEYMEPPSIPSIPCYLILNDAYLLGDYTSLSGGVATYSLADVRESSGSDNLDLFIEFGAGYDAAVASKYAELLDCMVFELEACLQNLIEDKNPDGYVAIVGMDAKAEPATQTLQ